MATSGSKSISVTKSDTLKFSWSLSSQSVSGNYSKVSWKLQLISGSYGAIYSSASKKWSVKVNGKSYSGSNTIGIGNNSTKTLASGSTTINHNSDGKKTFSYSFSQTFDITFNGSHVGTKSGSGSGTLTTIPRASSMSVPNITIGSAGTITVSKASSSFSHTITATFGSYSKTIVSKGTGTSYSFTPPMEWCNALPRSISGTATYKITTYSGSTAIGSKTYTATLYIPSSVVPTISGISHSETSLSSGWSGVYVKTKSKIQFRISCAGAYGSTIDSIVTNFDGKLLSGTPSPSATCNSAGEVAYIVIVTDSRGRRASKSGTINVMDYGPPQLIIFSAFRCNESGKADDNGERLSISKRFAITQLNNINTNKWKIEYKESGASSYSLLTSGTGYGINDTWISSAVFSVDKAYLLKITVEDSFHVVTREIKIPTAFTLIDFHSSGKGLAFGRVATSEMGAYFGMDVYDKFNTRIRNGLAYCPSGGADANITLEEISLCSKNIPYSSGFAYVWTVFYGNDKSVDTIKGQVAFPYSDTGGFMATRYYMDGSWSAWKRVLNYEDVEADMLYFHGKDYFVQTSSGGYRAKNLSTNKYFNLMWGSSNNEAVVGGGSYPPKSVLLKCENGSDFGISRDSDGERMYFMGAYNRHYTASPNCYITSAGTFGRQASSSKKYKKDIISIEENLERVKKLRSIEKPIDPHGLYDIPVMQYKYIEGYIASEDVKNDKDIIGLMAEDIAEHYEAAAIYDDEGNPEAWNSQPVLAGLLYLVQEQKKEIEELKKELETIKNEIAQLKQEPL